MAETTTIGAINRTLAEAMRADERVIVLGEDVAEGGPYTATAGLAEEFGTERVINTPISEAAITGVAIGAAQAGLRPVLEIMFVDFLTLALDQLVNAAAKAHFMSGGQLTVPLVVRTQGGAGPARRGAALAEPRELAHARPGAEGRRCRAVPSTPPACSRARSPTRTRSSSSSARRSTSARRRSPERARARFRSGRRSCCGEGRDVTVVALSRLVHEALAAAERLCGRGRDRGRGDRPAHARPARPRDDRRLGRAHRPARRRARGGRAGRLRRRDGRLACRRRRSTTSTRRSRASGRRSRPCRSARRSRTPTCPEPMRSSPPCEG